MSDRLRKVHALGQSIWYDYIQRRELQDGTLANLIDRGEISGVTSNPSIFHTAIAKTRDYDSALKPMALAGLSADEIYTVLSVEDIQAALDLFYPLYQKSSGRDGYVSLEVSPRLAHDTQGTLREAQSLWQQVNRPNLMVKIPATREGIPAVRAAIAAGLNINVTLIFSLDRYREVIDAYLAGLEDRLQAGLPVDRVASVASFFVSRVDTKVDQRLTALGTGSNLLGRAAINNARLAYALFKQAFSSPRFAALQAAGAQLQRPLWASTSTKNPAYRDVLYIEELIGENTVNTVPPQTLAAFRDHGNAELRLESGIEQAQAELAELEALGISMRKVTDELEAEGVKAFADAFQSMMDTIEERRKNVVRDAGRLAEGVKSAVSALKEKNAVKRMFERDGSLWTADPAGQEEARRRLGWLDAPGTALDGLFAGRQLKDHLAAEGFSHALLLGMGGSSLAPEVLAVSLAAPSGFPGLDLAILDSTDPAQVCEAFDRAPVEKTLFIVSSKSGSTAEVNAFLDAAWSLAVEKLGNRAGSHFIAITDPGTVLEKLAVERKFRAVFGGDPTVGGRYSALSAFGMVPAGLMGLDDSLVKSAQVMAKQCGPHVLPERNPGLVLGAAVAAGALAGMDKLCILADAPIRSLGSWLEQLVAESSGKEGKGIVPVDLEPISAPDALSADRLFVYLRLTGEHDSLVGGLTSAGHPLITLDLETAADLGAEFYRWEIATALACALMGVNAFDQPDVQDNKNRTVAKINEYHLHGVLAEGEPVWEAGGVKVYGMPFEGLNGCREIKDVIERFASQAKPGDYIAVNAYLPRRSDTLADLQLLREHLLKQSGNATTLGFGPRFLHSTGQLHKGGANNGLFIQITSEPEHFLPIPGQGMDFGTLERAQALGDLEALLSRGRRVIRVHLPRPEVRLLL